LMADKPYTSEQKSMDFKTLFTSEVGARVLADLDSKFFYKGDPFVPTSERATCVNIGLQRAARYIHEWIDIKLDEAEQNKIERKGVMENE